MEEEDTMDFKALRAKFQDEELLLKQPKTKPALPEKPKVVPPPQSPTYHLPAGARPSLLTSISQSLEGKTPIAPRVVFKDDKKESKKPLIQSNSKGKEKSEGKLKGKTTKGGKEKPDANGKTDLLDQKQKAESRTDKKLPLVPPDPPKAATGELVPAMPPPKATSSKKKGFLGFKKSVKKEVTEVATDPILDAPSPDVPGLDPLIPVPSVFGDATPEPAAETQPPKALLPDIPTLPDSDIAATVTQPSPIPDSVDINSPPAFIPGTPALKVRTPENETSPEIETPAPPVSISPTPATPTSDILTPPSPVPSPPTRHTQLAVSSPPSASSPSPPPPEPEVAAVAEVEVTDTAAVEEPPSPAKDTPSSPKAEHPISALSFLERAEEMSPGKKTAQADPRILNALEKARRKTISPQTNNTSSYSITPPPEELPPRQSPTLSIPELPPIDYEDQAGNALPVKPVEVNGIEHISEGVTEDGPDSIPELMVVPPPPPRKTLPEPPGPAPQKPPRPPTVDLSSFLPPAPEDNAAEIPAPPQFSEADTSAETPEFESSDAYSPELPVSEWGNGEYAGPDSSDGHTLPETMNDFYTNGITAPEVQGEPEFGVEFQDIPQYEPEVKAVDSPSPVSHDTQPTPGPQVEDGTKETGDGVYEDIITTTTKKKGKSEGGKKRKGPPKNPYAETPQPTNEEKVKTGRFGKNDKKTTPEGPDEKELKKKEKQRLEKEKKELKEQKEREKKEQKEREKKESEMKKKFKITGTEEAMYQAKVTVTTKGRKNDLPVNNGDIVSIIRTTNCPKGKWLARDSNNTFGYIAVDHVELDIQEMLELGKKAAITSKNSNNVSEPEVASMGSRTSNHYPLSTGSFTDDSEEWTCDDDEPLSPRAETVDPLSPQGHIRTQSMPDMGNHELPVNHQHSHSDISTEGPHMQARHEALQKLATFFHSPKPAEQPTASSTEAETSPVHVEEAAHPSASNPALEIDSELPDMLILPPPDLYADIITAE